MPLVKEFIIPFPPFAQKRHRDALHGKKYDPSARDKMNIALYVRAQDDGLKLHGPIHFGAIFYFPIPKSLSKKIKENSYKTTSPDLDNCEKFYCDALSFLYTNDAQIVLNTTEKRYSKNPRVVLIFKELDEDATD